MAVTDQPPQENPECTCDAMEYSVAVDCLIHGRPENPDGLEGPRQEQVDKWGTLFARIMDKRDGIGSQEAVDEAIKAVLGD